MRPLIYRNDLEGGGCNKVSIGDRASGRGHSREIISFFEDIYFKGFRRDFMIIVDAINDCLERIDAVDRFLIMILRINPCILMRNCLPMTSREVFRFAYPFSDLGKPLG
jgi:hypothetical protein